MVNRCSLKECKNKYLGVIDSRAANGICTLQKECPYMYKTTNKKYDDRVCSIKPSYHYY